MTQEFYKNRLTEQGIQVFIPDERDIETINRIIYQELCLGVFNPDSKKEFLRIIRSLQEIEVEAVIFGCTEIGLLLNPEDVPIPVFDTARIHAEKAAALAIIPASFKI